MSQDSMYAMPNRAQLAGADPEGFVLQIAPEQGIRVSLIDVVDGVAMDRRHDCFSLLIALPQGVQLASDVYRLFSPSGEQWVLLMTPVMPEPDGRHVLEAVIHCLIDAPATAND